MADCCSILVPNIGSMEMMLPNPNLMVYGDDDDRYKYSNPIMVITTMMIATTDPKKQMVFMLDCMSKCLFLFSR